jgi:plastocyanin
MLSRVHRRIAAACVVAAMCVVGLTVTMTAGAQSAQPAAKGKTVTVTLKGFMFNPMTVKIKAGTTVRWHWEDGADGDHDITPLHKKGGLMFKGTGVRTSGYYSVKFTKKGTYYYECSIHPLTMQAKIIVQ